jgi:poly-gamma-glutamate synthesis protein (capsule biosynthesis protein)
LGNHVFDQKYVATKEGLIADCRIRQNALRCSNLRTHTPIASSFPELANGYAPADNPLASCEVPLHSTLTISGYALRPQPSLPETTSREIWMDGFMSEGPQAGRLAWRTRPAEVLSLEAGRLAGPNSAMFLLSLEKHLSPIDSENDPRPYVYEVGRSGFIARWRGSALAWPLVDAQLLSGQDGVLCALHRNDSFLMLSPQSKATRVAAYRWNGFGFDGISAEATVSACRNLLGVATANPEIPADQSSK